LTSNPVEDRGAVVLAKRLRDLPDTPGAFAAYERLRRDRVQRIVASAARTSNMKAAGPIARMLRDLMMPVFLRRAAGRGDRSMPWMHDHHISWDEKVAA
jgi:2-polyprenyl-6-methoxyphenol hydroxylase-like FAD-dependent oxidoreductase